MYWAMQSICVHSNFPFITNFIFLKKLKQGQMHVQCAILSCNLQLFFSSASFTLVFYVAKLQPQLASGVAIDEGCARVASRAATDSIFFICKFPLVLSSQVATTFATNADCARVASRTAIRVATETCLFLFGF